MWKEIGDREFGKLRPNLFSNRIKSARIASIQLSNYKDFISPHRGSVNSLQVDLTEGRYLLSSASDASVAVYDVQRATDYDGSGLIAKHKHIFFVDKQHEQGHKYVISTAIWYPIDTGLFITGSYDHYVNVWDTNTTQVVINFKMPGKVYKTAMSPVATSHMLIAAGTEDVQVRLCDISSGAFAHTLSGHRDGVMSVEWSASSEWVLVTGGCDGAIRFWDIRRAGCFRVLDQSHSQLGRRPTLLTRSTANKSSTLKSSSGGPNSSAKGRPSQKKTGNGVCIKHSAIARQVRGSGKQRLHPGMMSSQDRATAHYGAVNGLKIYTQMGSDDISVVRFVFSNSNSIKPIIIKLKDKNQTSSTNTDDEKQMIKNSEFIDKNTIHEVSNISASEIDRERKVEFKRRKFFRNLKLANFKKPTYYMPLAIILILIFLAVYGRCFAILCTSIGWYIIPTIKARSRRTKRKYVKKSSEKNVAFCEGPIFPRSVMNGPKDHKLLAGKHGDKSS